MSKGELVLDNSVFSAFAAGGWFHEMSFWTRQQYELYTTDRIWFHEFSPHHAFSKPDWLFVEEVDTSKLVSKTVTLGEADWSLIRLAETLDNPVLVSNDKQLLEETERRGIEPIWGSKFLKQTFESCGIDRRAYDTGLSNYVRDVHLPEEVASELQSAEKK